jgi:CBS domain-containing protein|tara:strand:+ start:2975 stop:3514 length:540 start_codon:yes stop_codon:yes gene_type:complete
MVNSKLPVRDVMVSPVITITPEETVNKAAKTMLKNGIGGLIVVEDFKPVGIITERDFVGLLAKKKDPGEILVKNVMSKKLITVSPEEGLMDVAKLIVKTGKRKLPVMDKNKLVGILTADDIVKAAPGEVETLRELTNIKSEDVTFHESPTSGNCETCGNYSETLAEVNEIFVCEDCKEA